MSTDSFRDFVLEHLATLDGLRCKRMLGGHGLYCGAVFFGILLHGQLHFRTHPDTLPDYLACGAPVFAPSEKQVLQNYREVPAEILEDNDRLMHWARKAARQ